MNSNRKQQAWDVTFRAPMSVSLNNIDQVLANPASPGYLSLLEAMMKRFRAPLGFVNHRSTDGTHAHIFVRHSILFPVNHGSANGGMKVITGAGAAARDLMRYHAN
jgi:hypothetical protein